MPTATDLVTDLPADFEVFGQAVATSMQDLLGGTTGQVLAKASNADMDFVWSADAAGMTNPMTTTGDIIYSSPGSTPVRRAIGSTGQGLTVVAGIPAWAATATSTLTTTGDMLYASAANTLARVGVGSTGQVLTVAGGVPTWAAPSSKVVQIVNATYATTTTIGAGVTTTTGLTATITPTSASNKVLVFFSQTAGTSGQGYLNAFYLQRNGTNLGSSYGGEYLYNNGISYIVPGGLSGSYLDSPATTSATVYRTVVAVSGGGGSVGMNWNGSQATMTLMEVTP